MFGQGSTPSMCQAPHLRNPNMTKSRVDLNWVSFSGWTLATSGTEAKAAFLWHDRIDRKLRNWSPNRWIQMVGSSENLCCSLKTVGWSQYLYTGFAHGKETRWNFRWLTSGHPTSPENLAPDGSCMTLTYPCASGKRLHEPHPWIGGTVGWFQPIRSM